MLHLSLLVEPGPARRPPGGQPGGEL